MDHNIPFGRPSFTRLEDYMTFNKPAAPKPALDKEKMEQQIAAALEGRYNGFLRRGSQAKAA